MPLFRPRIRRPPGNIELCLPRPVKAPPTGPDWIHEIKHDGFRILARRDGPKVRLISRNGHDLTYRFPLAAAAVAALPVYSCSIDGEAIVCDGKGLAVFQFIRNYRRGNIATICAFDLIEIDGRDMRQQRPKVAAHQVSSRHYLQSALRRRRRYRLSPCVQARLRRHRVQAHRLTVSRGTIC
jgi:ATP-dependent DNA ligase